VIIVPACPRTTSPPPPSPSFPAARTVHHALGEPVRLAIAETLALTDRTPSELESALDVPSNLMAHHLDILEAAGLIRRTKSSGDARRRYVTLVPEALDGIAVLPLPPIEASRVLFVCTANSARSPLAEVIWRSITSIPAASAGTRPALAVHPLALAAADRAGLAITHGPQQLEAIRRPGDLVVTVCDQAREGGTTDSSLHWSIPDPAEDDRLEAFAEAGVALTRRIHTLARCMRAPGVRTQSRTGTSRRRTQ
jgi:ArsR family transcriptional regulator, arsenate/arsenite/antimonite-responsive transcriptional repressor / arsenate reductase (thioredoxin)